MGDTSIFFERLAKHLNDLKTALYASENYTNPNDPEVRQLLLQHKNLLNGINSKLKSYREDVNSTIEHIDSVLDRSTNIIGGKKMTKRKKNRKNRRSRKKL